MKHQPCSTQAFPTREFFFVVSASASKFTSLKYSTTFPQQKCHITIIHSSGNIPHVRHGEKKAQGRTFKVLLPTLEELNQIYFFVEIFIIWE
jgi:hypothetical protein